MKRAWRAAALSPATAYAHGGYGRSPRRIDTVASANSTAARKELLARDAVAPAVRIVAYGDGEEPAQPPSRDWTMAASPARC